MLESAEKPSRLVIIRHGNTFRADETPRWVGRRTDLHLVEEERAGKAAAILLERKVVPDKVYAAPLHRTMETASIIKRQMGLTSPVVSLDAFSEIDYGPDENRTEREVTFRLGTVRLRETNPERAVDADFVMAEGRKVLDAWNAVAAVPPGWIVDVNGIIGAWRDLAKGIVRSETVMVVSSNGIIRFAPHLLRGGYEEFCAQYTIKVSTGGVCIFENAGNGWECVVWNSKENAVNKR